MKLLTGPLFLLTLSTLASHLHPASAQSEGDVRLEGPPGHPNLGRLEILWEGKWSTFCGLSTGGAQAACRQLGYLDFLIYKPLSDVNENLNITEASPNTPIAIDHTNCDRSFSNGLLHVLRCGYSTEIASDCNHRNDIVLQCQTTPLWQHPYDTQVRLGEESGTSLSSGTLEIYLNDKWGNVCGNYFSAVAADSACRQMGYTSASEHGTTGQGSKDTVWLDNVRCEKAKGSCNCLGGCLDKLPTTPITSCSQTNKVHLTCTYDVTIQDKAPSGSSDKCENRQTAAVCNGSSGGGGGKGSQLSPGGVAGVVIGVLVGVVVVVSIVLVAVFVIMPRYRKGRYTVLN